MYMYCNCKQTVVPVTVVTHMYSLQQLFVRKAPLDKFNVVFDMMLYFRKPLVSGNTSYILISEC